MPDDKHSTIAWLLRAAENIQFCIGVHQAAEYIESPSLHEIPMAPGYCKNILFWRGIIVPVIDIKQLAGNAESNTDHIVMVIAYQVKDNTPIEHIGFVLESAPQKIQVYDENICELPESYPELLKPYVVSLFKHKDKIASILNIAQMSIGNLKTA